ncbi:MAG: extracellular solute-binding protein [Tepidimonas taiwanensis]|nr:extracellular solute-binding protein [Tepidimonas taiwanensis]
MIFYARLLFVSYPQEVFLMNAKRQTLRWLASLTAAASLLPVQGLANDKVLRLLTWADYAPKEVIEQFTRETGIKVEVTLSNNEEMIAKLRATGGAGFDLVQPSQDRIVGPQMEFGIYKPLDLSKIHTDRFIPSMLEATKKNTTVAGKVYAVPHIWGTDGLVVNTKSAPNVRDYPDLCRPEYAGKVSMRLKRPTLIAFAFASGKDPFALYNDSKAYTALMEEVGQTLMACKKNVKYFFDNKDQLLAGIRSGELTAAMMWDTGGWSLNRTNPDIRFIAPQSGALGWVDTFAIPAKGRNDEAAYAWINFNLRPDIAAKVVKSVGNFTAVKGGDADVDPVLRRQFQESFPETALKNIKWYPPVPAGLEEIEGRILDRIKAAR